MRKIRKWEILELMKDSIIEENRMVLMEFGDII
jgi:hypothetical protein